MGNVRLGVPAEAALRLKEAMGIRWFVETGTYKGGTMRWAAENFEWVISIEMHDFYYKEALKNCPDNALIMRGDSRTELGKALEMVGEEPAMLWLDAHWCGNYELSVNTPGECPLMEELGWAREGDAILIDDARLFLNPPPMPHDPEQWPSFEEIVKKLEGRKITVFEDVIVAVPREFAKALE